MKNPETGNKRQDNNKGTMGPANNNKPRPEIRDNLDHREGEEQDNKGQDVTHNKKDTKEEKLKHKK